MGLIGGPFLNKENSYTLKIQNPQTQKKSLSLKKFGNFNGRWIKIQIDFKIRTIELDRKRIKLQILLGKRGFVQ
ncbi:hypothetical protein ES332_A07G189000v1 [Gossypium tomentosum]|uniref:Uncharacterized protein n=1 Tax=Gossypium tomentosum TaxID=34277 RepID=A0A5D2PXM4_GOSTO|nr:hypothetical protein ES332_A07G189000v1 [Gossypium tomentosum]